MNLNKTYIGIVEDNIDPKKIGRVKIRVMDVYDNMPIENIPWASPWKDLNGNSFNVPEKGKIVLVVFDQGRQDSPEFIYAEHYNINLENKLSKLSDDDYTTMKSLIFDHKTQIFVNESNGLVIDHKYNNLNITKGGIDMNLKDNNGKINIGDADSDQQAILGNNFMDWLSDFLTSIESGGLLTPTGAAFPSPKLLVSINKFKALKDITFLSHNVNIVDNNKVNKVMSTDREDESQYGDKWTSTEETNQITEKKAEDAKPEPGPNKEYDKEVDEEDPNNTDVLFDAILMAGMDYRTTDLSIEQQVELFQKGFGQNKSVKVFKYNTNISELSYILEDNPKIPIFLFSSSCYNAYDISKLVNVDKNKLFIIEPYSTSETIKEVIKLAIGNGVPSSNVFVGDSSDRGLGTVVGESKSNAENHISALRTVGEMKSSI